MEPVAKMAAMNAHKPIQIFKPGRHIAASGTVISFAESDLQASAAAYDPAKHEAPLVVGHPKHDAPAYGWVKGLSFADGLDATPDQVDPEFAEMVAAGRFKKISASFYAPDAPNNPVPGVFYLRHVGFLGAQPPAVKGLRSPEFADAEEGVVEFADWGDMQNAALWRRMRDFFIEKFGLDKADSVLPDYAVASLEDEARKETDDVSSDNPSAPAPAFTETQGDDMSVEEKARLAALETENKNLKADATARAEKDAADRRTVIHAGNASFAEGLIKEGKLLPAISAVAVAVLDDLANREQVVEFGEGDAKKPLVDAFKEFLTAQPKIVDFKERAGGAAQDDKPEDASTIAAEALAYQEEQAKAGSVINIAQAVVAVQAKKAAAAS